MKLLLGIIALGILSRVLHTGIPLFDKYLGDALYAAMVYVILRLLTLRKPWLFASLIMLSLEMFQLTGIPAELVASGQLLVRFCGLLMGTQFSGFDLLAYGVGIWCVYLMDRQAKSPTQHV